MATTKKLHTFVEGLFHKTTELHVHVCLVSQWFCVAVVY